MLREWPYFSSSKGYTPVMYFFLFSSLLLRLSTRLHSNKSQQTITIRRYHDHDEGCVQLHEHTHTRSSFSLGSLLTADHELNACSAHLRPAAFYSLFFPSSLFTRPRVRTSIQGSCEERRRL